MMISHVRDVEGMEISNSSKYNIGFVFFSIIHVREKDIKSNLFLFMGSIQIWFYVFLSHDIIVKHEKTKREYSNPK